MRLAVPAAMGACLLASCATACGGGGPAMQLQISLSPEGPAGATTQWTLECAPAGGTHPRVEEACRRLEGLNDDLFAPVPTLAVCAQIFGGPATARVTGTYRRDDIDARFSKINGCEIARWNRLAFLIAPINGRD